MNTVIQCLLVANLIVWLAWGCFKLAWIISDYCDHRDREDL